ncbi:MAG: hypothetical protein H7Z41_17670 [Cytophagales bacterium]|nr:hypothetical protein [Armatimonadota bacterium]
MVTLYTWLPAPPHTVLGEGIMPDMGHSSLLIHDDSGQQEDLYCSFWPEMESPIRRVVSLWKNRTVRHPESYAEETGAEAGFMQRPADYTERLSGLREDRLRQGWNQIKETDYELSSWNCASVLQCLLVAAMERERYEAVQDAATCSLSDLGEAGVKDAEIGGVLRYLATSKLIGCRPEDVHRLAEAYQAAFPPE